MPHIALPFKQKQTFPFTKILDKCHEQNEQGAFKGIFIGGFEPINVLILI
ncbi:hypothetical protein [Pedobacter agri]|nr:hypothetical protein [Pedobacter agri]MDQ1141899.1 hypothetical protein [Pedobacter agri]